MVPPAAEYIHSYLLSHNSYLLQSLLSHNSYLPQLSHSVLCSSRHAGTAPSNAVGAAICRPGNRCGDAGGHTGPPLQGHASHSDLCSSHQAGNAGSFGERVGVILCLNPEFPLKVKGAIVLEPTPKWKNCNKVSLFIVQIFP